MKSLIIKAYLLPTFLFLLSCSSQKYERDTLSLVSEKYTKHVKLDSDIRYAVIESRDTTSEATEVIIYTLMKNWIPIDSILPSRYMQINGRSDVPILDDLYFERWGRYYSHDYGYKVVVTKKGKVKYKGYK